MTSACGSGICEEVARGGRDTVGQARRSDRPLGDRHDDREVIARAPKMRMVRGEDRAELAGRAPDVAHRLVLREVELLGQRVEVSQRDALHRGHELLEPRRVAVELVEHRLAGVLDLVLRLARLQRLGQIAPERIQPCIGHLQDSADVGRAPLVQEHRGLGSVAIAATASVAVALQEPQRDQGVEKVVDPSGVEAEPFADLLPGHRLGAELREQLELHRREHRLRRPESHADLHDVGWVGLHLRHVVGHPTESRVWLELTRCSGHRPVQRTEAAAAPSSSRPPPIANPIVISRCSFFVPSCEPSAL